MSTLSATLLNSGNLRGMLWMVLSGAVFATNYTTIRFLAEDFHVFELVFFRNLFGLLVLAPFIWRMRHQITRTKRPGLVIARGVCQTSASAMWFFGLTVIPLAMATSLMLIEPVVGSVLAIVFFKERSNIRRWLAVIVGLAGALLIVRPGFADISIGALLILLASFFWAGYLLLGKVQTRDESAVVVVAYASAVTIPLSLIPALFFWVTPTLEQLGFLLLMGAVATLAYYCITKAYGAGEVTVIAPFTFARTLFAAVVGFFIFREIPEVWVWLGAGLIVIAATYLARFEMKNT